MRWILGVFETGLLLHINILRQEAMEKSVAHINPMKCPTTRDSNRENQTDSSRLHNRAKGVTIVNTLLLREPTRNEASLVFLNRAIWSVFGFEDPFAADNISVRRSGNLNGKLHGHLFWSALLVATSLASQSFNNSEI
jgi:hypothetical protein